jgi:hypothetical protein
MSYIDESQGNEDMEDDESFRTNDAAKHKTTKPCAKKMLS